MNLKTHEGKTDSYSFLLERGGTTFKDNFINKAS